MWTRFELKERGKAAFQRNYWRSVLVAFILMLFVSGGGSAVSNSWNQITSSGTSDDSYYTEYFDDGDIGHFYYNSGTSIPDMLVSGIIAVVVGGVMIVSALLGIFLFNPLEVGGCRFFMENSEYQPTVGRLGFAFQKGMYGKTVLTLFLRKLFIGLWLRIRHKQQNRLFLYLFSPFERFLLLLRQWNPHLCPLLSKGKRRNTIKTKN